jgi:4-diphosphocytidyl-2-C-methyl-D-erythritol kinase
MTSDEHEIRVLPSRPRLRALAGGGLCVAAPAKLNLHLRVGPVRPDGFHPVDSIVAKITLYDEIELRARDDGRIMFVCEGFDCGPDRTNLAHRAARLLRQRAASAGADIHLRKAVPPGAGLGGGSSDAAAVLFGLNVLWKLGLAAAELSLLGAALGSDVPLFLGPPCCRVTGRGEIVEPADVPDFVAVLILLGVPCATGEVYRAYDASGAQIGPKPDRKMLAGLPPSRWRGLLRNDLTAAARSVCAELDSAWRRLAAEPAVPICMTGSGSAMFVLCDDEAQAAEVRRSLPADLRAGGVTVRRNPW